MPFETAVISAVRLDFPMSTAPPTTADAIAEPLAFGISVTSSPTLRKSPASCA